MFFRQLDCDIQLSLSIPQYAEKLFQLTDGNRDFLGRCAVENSRSRAIPERLGFKNEGIIRRAEKVYDEYLDHVVYGWLKSDNHQSA